MKKQNEYVPKFKFFVRTNRGGIVAWERCTMFTKTKSMFKCINFRRPSNIGKPRLDWSYIDRVWFNEDSKDKAWQIANDIGVHYDCYAPCRSFKAFTRHLRKHYTTLVNYDGIYLQGGRGTSLMVEVFWVKNKAIPSKK
jgi:hypothetical protein